MGKDFFLFRVNHLPAVSLHRESQNLHFFLFYVGTYQNIAATSWRGSLGLQGSVATLSG